MPKGQYTRITIRKVGNLYALNAGGRLICNSRTRASAEKKKLSLRRQLRRKK